MNPALAAAINAEILRRFVPSERLLKLRRSAAALEKRGASKAAILQHVKTEACADHAAMVCAIAAEAVQDFKDATHEARRSLTTAERREVLRYAQRQEARAWRVAITSKGEVRAYIRGRAPVIIGQEKEFLKAALKRG